MDTALKKLSPDQVFGDTIYNICQFLNIRDLYNVSLVCKAWRKAAKKEIKSRGIQLISVHENYNSKIIDQFRVKPRVGLFFVQQDFDSDYPREIIIGEKYKENFPEEMVLIGADTVYTEKSTFKSEISFKSGINISLVNMPCPSAVPCALLPNHENFETRYSWLTRLELQNKKTEQIWDKIISDLTPKNKDNPNFKTIFMIFTFLCGKKFFTNLGRYFRSSFTEKNYVVWGSELFFMPIVHDRKTMNLVEECPPMSFVGISLCLPNHDVFNTTMLCEQIKLSTFPQPLLDFKDKVKLKKQSFAFINGPLYNSLMDGVDSSEEEGDEFDLHKLMDEFYSNDYEQRFLYHFKKIFPEVPFISMFRDSMCSTISNDVTNGKTQGLKRMEAISIMIITHN